MTLPKPNRMGAEEWCRLHDLAIGRAQALRRQASDDFWRACRVALQASWTFTIRCGGRLFEALAHGARRRFKAPRPTINPKNEA